MSHVDDLAKLAELKEKKIITQEEYEENKSKLMQMGLVSSGSHNGAKSQGIYCVLALLIGGYGVHNFYAGRIGSALGQLGLRLVMIIIGGVIGFEAGMDGRSLEEMDWSLVHRLGWFISIWVLVDIFCVGKDGQGKPLIPSKTAQWVCFGLQIVFMAVEAMVLHGGN